MGNHRTTRRSVLKATGVGAATLPLAGCFGDDGGNEDGIDSGDIAEGGSFTVGLSGELEALNPLTAGSVGANAVLDLVYQRGVIVEPEGFAVMPWVFTDWGATETADGMEIGFDVREDLAWTDGEAFTVADVIFTYEYYMDHEPARFRSAIRPMESIAAGRDYDLVLTLEEPVGTYEVEQFGLRLLPEHVWSGVDDPLDRRPAEPVGLGPGRVTDPGPDAAVEVELARDWPLTDQEWVRDHDALIEGGPFLDSVRFRGFDGDDDLRRAFLDGEIDSIHGSTFDGDRAPDVEDRDGRGFVTGGDDGYRHVTFNMRTPPLDDQAFRQALCMAMDRDEWTDGMALGPAIPGSVVVPPAFEHIRPETAAGEDVRRSPDGDVPESLRALWFREDDGGDLDVGAIREFLESGAVVTGEAGTYAGFEYPGSLTDFGGTSRTEAVHDYAFGEVRSSLLRDLDVDRELYVDGMTVEELNDGPLTMLNYPSRERPRVADFTGRYVENVRRLGVPIEREPVAFDTMAKRVYLEADFDVYPMDWSDLSSRGVPSLYDLFHSDNAHGQDADGDTFAYNAAGYGLEGVAGADDAIEELRAEPDDEDRNEGVARLAERIYLEAPTLVRSHDVERWPVNTDDFGGYIPDIAGPGSSNLWLQLLNAYRHD